MPRRGTEVVQLPVPPKKKTKIVEEPAPSLDLSFCDDEALAPGIVFSDVQQKKWRIGKPIGRGSFGRIYLASDNIEKEVTKNNASYVVKIEPHTNGPLFVEVHCLIRTAQVDKIKSWRRSNKQKCLGMPVYIASGSFTDDNTGIKYRFLVLPRYDIDLQKVIARTKVLDLKNVLVLAIQILDVLEYLHSQGYTHSDIKSSNLMLGFDGGKLNKMPVIKPAPSFQKDTKEVAVLAGKHRKVKSAHSKSRASNYYDDEDFIVNEKADVSVVDDEVKRKLRKILTDPDSRTLQRHHAFNLRQLSNYVNYEDLNSSVCSDQSYQKLLDDFSNRSFIRNSEEFYPDFKVNNDKQDKPGEVDLNEIRKEAILSQSNGQIYLLDYGLASKFLDSKGNHKVFCMDARKAHDGTLEYSSRDSHIGAHSRRSDLETLGYNLIDWLTGTLPWKTTEVLAEPDLVHALKKNVMSDIKTFLKTCFKTEFYPQFMEKYLEYVTSLDFVERPDYDYCRSLFKSELLKNGCNKDMSLNFAETPISPMGRKVCYSKRFGRKNTGPDFLARNGIKKAYERENFCSVENDLKLELLKQTLNSSSDGMRKPCTSRNFFVSDAELVARLKKSLMPHDVLGKKLSPKNLRSQKKNMKKRRGVRKHRNSIGKFGNFMGSARQFTWAEILAGNPEDIIRKERNTQAKVDTEDEDDEETCKYRIRKLSNASETSDTSIPSPIMNKDYLKSMNPTNAMKEVVANLKRKVSGKHSKEPEEPIEGLEGYTPAMIAMYRIKQKREAREKLEMLKQAMACRDPVVIVPRCRRSIKGTTPKKVATRKQTSSESSNESEASKVEKTRQSKHQVKKSCGSKVETQTKRMTRATTSMEKIVSKEVKKTNPRQSKRLKEVQKPKKSTRSSEEKMETDVKTVVEKPKRTSTRTRRSKSLKDEVQNPKRSLRSSEDKMETDISETVGKSKRTSTRSSKKEVKIVEVKPPSARCKKSPPRARPTSTTNNGRCLRSSRRNKQ